MINKPSTIGRIVLSRTGSKRIDYRHVVAHLLLVAGVIMAIWLTWVMIQGYLAQSWPKTKAIIYESSMSLTSSTPSKHYYQIHIRYKYRIKNTHFSNKQLYIADVPLLNESEARELIEYYSIGSIHDVFFEPQNPNNAVLKTGVSNVLILLTAPTLLFLGIGLSARKR